MILSLRLSCTFTIAEWPTIWQVRAQAKHVEDSGKPDFLKQTQKILQVGLKM
jgi:hypothetical protein